MTNTASYPSLDNKVVVITGGASGIGAALSIAFARQGARVVILDIDECAALKLLETHSELKRQLAFHHLDVCQISALQHEFDNIHSEYDGIDILINNVANDDRHNPLSVTPEYWQNSLAVNLNPTFFASQKAITFMRERGTGVIINFSSINALFAPPEMPAYVAAKSAILGLTKALAKQFGPDGIRVNCILPGWIATEKQLKSWLTPEEEKAWDEQLALKGRIEPEEVAKLALFLAADDSAKITGQQFTIDAGRL